MSDINLTPDWFYINLFLKVNNDKKEFTVECNWCTEGENRFSTSDTSHGFFMFEPGWVERAVNHFTDEHPQFLK